MKNFYVSANQKWDAMPEPRRFLTFMVFMILGIIIGSLVFREFGALIVAIVGITLRAPYFFIKKS